MKTFVILSSIHRKFKWGTFCQRSVSFAIKCPFSYLVVWFLFKCNDARLLQQIFRQHSGNWKWGKDGKIWVLCLLLLTWKSLRLIIIGVSVSPVSGSPVPVFLAPKTPCPTFCHWSQPPQAHWVTTKTIIKHAFFASYFFIVYTVLYSFFCFLVLASSCFLLIQCFFSFLFCFLR